MPGYELWGEDERREVEEVLETGILMRYGFDGPRRGRWKAKELEAELCRATGARHAQVVSSGTAALSTALAALGVGAGDEVVMPTFTFVASFEAVLSVGAVPVLADVDDTLTLSPQAARAAVTARTKVLMPVHMCGAMADLDALGALAREKGLALLEDACQAFGGTWRGKALGTVGKAGCYSFDFVKTVTCGEGGAVVTDDEETWRRCDQFSDHGHDHLGADRGADLHPVLGTNYRISELHAAVGLAQVRRLQEFLRIQRRNKGVLRAALERVPGVTFRRIPDPAGDSATFLSFFLPDEGRARAATAAMKAAGLGAMHWYDNNWHYVRRWGHLREGATLTRWPEEVRRGLAGLAGRSFAASDAVIGRAISTPVSLTWSEAEAAERAARLAAAVRGV
ncbi:MAG TPA: aminotransferase class I/II-fold pyridoxal phosphate-dependent enzyme [Anaeromyxobacteraceae bacterium]|nr:aminotransferase class I/II-fold pyridoxal phosphate-dependent enzyme [Anaeromyxobacteraceae bacterium]